MDDNILYELLVYSEWKQDFEQTVSDASLPTPKKSFVGKLLSLFRKRLTIPELIYEQVGCKSPWQFCVGDGGKVIAILQDTLLEIRSSKDEYSSIIGKAAITKDEWPQWRRMCWSPDCSFLAIASSNGIVHFYDLLGCNIFNISPDCSIPSGSLCKEIQHAVAGIIFIKNRIKEHKWSSEVLLIDYNGNLRSFLISPTDGYQLNHKFSFENHFKDGVSAVALHPSHPILIVSGSGNKDYDSRQDGGRANGLSAWRILNDAPFYKLSENIQEKSSNKQKPSWTGKTVGIVFKLSICSSGSLLACLHSCGTISIWRMPSLILVNIWKLTDQPDYNIPNPLLEDEKYYKGVNLTKMSPNSPVDINWWNDDAIILSRYSGAVSVNSIKDLRNLLGNNPEFLSGQPQLSPMVSDKGFITLECESEFDIKKNNRGVNNEVNDVSENGLDSDNLDVQMQKDLLYYIINVFKHSLYVMTYLDKFRPVIPHNNSVIRTYRMLGLKSSTPEELYSRKIDSGDFAEALSLAKIYDLDTDLVYKRQWQNSKISSQSIMEYLSKIKKRWWVLQQCVDRVADSIEASRELLLFGMRICNFNVLINKDNSSIDTIDQANEEEICEAKIDDEKLSEKCDLESLNADQKELIRYRMQILKYLDRLLIYEMVLNSRDYDCGTYNEFRTSSTLQTAVKFSRQGDCESLNILLEYYSDELHEHIFPLLSNLPETLDPSEFCVLVPQCDSSGSANGFQKKSIRKLDWCETEKLRSLCGLGQDIEVDSSDWLYEDLPDLKLYHGISNPTQITQWYISRVREIEHRTGVVDNALKLINIAMEKNVQNLDQLHFDLETLDCLVYEVGVVDVTLSDLQQSSKLECGKWLMSKSTENTFINDLSRLFLSRINQSSRHEDNMQLLQEYIQHLSTDDLKWALLYLDHLKKSAQEDCISTKLDLPRDQIIELAIGCIYSNQIEDLEQIETAGMILECLPEIAERHPLSSQLADLEGELQCSKLLHVRGIPQSAKEIHEARADVSRATELLNNLSRSVLRMHPSEIDWNNLLTDMISIRDTVFDCIDVEEVFEMYVTTLLLCGQKKDIESAAEVMHCCFNNSTVATKGHSKLTRQDSKIPYERSVQLVLNAAREYFDSSRSLDDKNMDLAKACLSLITDDVNDEIKEELDLIAAIKILHGFHVPILPIQVRLCPDRLRLIEQCLNSAENKSTLSFVSTGIAQSNSSDKVVLDLAKRLRIFGNDDKKREGAVLEMLTKDALIKYNWNLCWSYSQRLIAGDHGSHWRVVTELARQGESLHTSIRKDALDFALLHCDGDDIEELLGIRDEIEIKELKLRLEFLSAKEEDPESGVQSPVTTPTEEFHDPLSSVKELPGNITKVIKMLNPTDILKDSTLQLISHISDKGFLKLREIDELNISPNETFAKESYPCFYSSLHENCLESNFYYRYDRFSNPEITCKELEICRILLKLALLEHDSDNGATIHDMDEVILQYATYIFPEDITFGLALLLLLKDPCEAKRVFDSFPVSLAVLRTYIYCIALQIVSSDIEYSSKADLTSISSSKLLTLALSMENSEHCNSELISLLHECRNKMQDLCQAEELQTLGCGVDTQRFTSDEGYRRDSILGLAMSPQLNRYNLALKLGKRHNINLPSIAFEHVSSLLQSPEVPMNILSERLDDQELLQLLKEQPEEFCDRLSKEVFPTLDGTQHEILMYYFVLLDKIHADHVSHGVLCKEHVKLLKKIKSSCSVVDYTLLLNPPDNFVSLITSNITQVDLPILCKLLKSLPTQMSSKCQYTQSLLYKEWCKKHVSQMPPHSTSREYSSCWNSITPLFAKINAEDFKMFLHHIVLSPKSVNDIDIACRLSLLKQAMAYCNVRMKQDRIEGWSFTHSDFLIWESVLKSLCSESWQNLLLYGDEISNVVKLIQASCTNDELLLSAFAQLLKIEQLPLEYIIGAMKEFPNSPRFFSLLKCLIKNHGDDSSDYVRNLTVVITRLENFLEFSKSSSISSRDDPNVGSGDWDNEWNIDDDIEDDGKIETDCLSDTEKKELCDIFLPLCSDPVITSTLRLRIMKILQDLNVSTDNEFNTVMLYQHTQATVASAWKVEGTDDNIDLMQIIENIDLSTEPGRFQMFELLLSKTTEWNQIEHLNDLLIYWPKFMMAQFVDNENPGFLLLRKILSFDGSQNVDDLHRVLSKISQTFSSSDTIIENLHKEFKDSLSDRSAILFDLLLSNDTEFGKKLKAHAVGIINQIQEPLEDNILKLIASKHLVPQIVGSKSYKSILEFSLLESSQDGNESLSTMVEPKQIVEDLLDAHLVAEAGAFSLSSLGTPAGLRTFSSALKWARRLYDDDVEE